MTKYDGNSFHPPAPVALVTLRSLGRNAELGDVMMLIDSGADVSLIPQKAADHLGLAPLKDKQYQLSGFDDAESSALAVEAELVFCERTFRGRFLLLDQKWGILGRNVLNAVRLILDGPKRTWDYSHKNRTY